jgi:hypothetical protein
MTKQALVNQQYNLVIPITMYSTSVSESHQNNKMIRTILFIHRNDSKNIFDIYVTEYGTALTTILPILFLYLNTVTVTAGTFEP